MSNKLIGCAKPESEFDIEASQFTGVALCKDCEEKNKTQITWHLPTPKLEPITAFNSNEELQSCLEWWQKRLGLQDWIIEGVLSDMKDDDETAGRCIHIPTDKVALIKINSNMSFIELHEQRIMKSPMELTLVHELLHARISILENKEGTYEAKIAETFEHTLIEDMAKALIMAKYNLTLDYFRNF